MSVLNVFISVEDYV